MIILTAHSQAAGSGRSPTGPTAPPAHSQTGALLSQREGTPRRRPHWTQALVHTGAGAHSLHPGHKGAPRQGQRAPPPRGPAMHSSPRVGEFPRHSGPGVRARDSCADLPPGAWPSVSDPNPLTQGRALGGVPSAQWEQTALEASPPPSLRCLLHPRGGVGLCTLRGAPRLHFQAPLEAGGPSSAPGSPCASTLQVPAGAGQEKVREELDSGPRPPRLHSGPPFSRRGTRGAAGGGGTPGASARAQGPS